MNRKRSNKYVFADRVADLLIAQALLHSDDPKEPRGLSTIEIYSKLLDVGKGRQWIPARSSMGSRLSSIPGLVQMGFSRGYTIVTSRPISVWTIDVDRYNAWRSK